LVAHQINVACFLAKSCRSFALVVAEQFPVIRRPIDALEQINWRKTGRYDAIARLPCNGAVRISHQPPRAASRCCRTTNRSETWPLNSRSMGLCPANVGLP